MTYVVLSPLCVVTALSLLLRRRVTVLYSYVTHAYMPLAPPTFQLPGVSEGKCMECVNMYPMTTRTQTYTGLPRWKMFLCFHTIALFSCAVGYIVCVCCCFFLPKDESIPRRGKLQKR